MGQANSSEVGGGRASRLRLPSASRHRATRSASLPSTSRHLLTQTPATPSMTRLAKDTRLYKALKSRVLGRGSGGRSSPRLPFGHRGRKASLPLLSSSGGLKGKAAKDQARVFRELVAGWSAQDLHCLVVEYEAAAALRELAWRADAARPKAPRLQDDLGRLLRDGLCTDLTLLFDAHEFPAHAALLRARSGFFASLLQGARTGDRVTVSLPKHFAQIDAGVFRLLLEYLYTGEIGTEARAGLGGELELMLRLKEEFQCPRTLEQDAYRLLEAAPEAGDALLVFVAHSSTPLPSELSYDDDEGTLRAGGSGQGQPEAQAPQAQPEEEDGTVSAEEDLAVWRQGFSEQQPQGSRSRPLSLASSASSYAEFRCHWVVLAARSPFLRGLIQRRLNERLLVRLEGGGGGGGGRAEEEPMQIQLDESVLPRLYAPVLLHALYTDQVELSKVIRGCPIPVNSLHEVQAIASGKCQVAPIDEATEVFTLANFLDFPALAQGCESLIVEAVSADCVVGVYNWSVEGHGSAYVRRHCVNYLGREFSRVAASSVLLDLEEALLYETLRSDFVQASELEILQAVVRWGEQTLMRRLEEREPNLIATTTHSISRKGVRRADLSDAELRSVLRNLLPLVRSDYVLPPFHPAIVSATSRGLVSSPPLDLPGSEAGTLQRTSLQRRPKSRHQSGLSSRLGGSMRKIPSASTVIEGRGLGNPDGHWLHPHATGTNPLAHRRQPRPRYFVPYAVEARAQLSKRLAEEPGTELLGHGSGGPGPDVASPQPLPDALYMLSPDHSAAAQALEEERWGAGSSDESCCSEEELPAAEVLAGAEERVRAQLRSSSTAQRALACGCAHHRRAVLRQLRLRAVRELGAPDWAVRVLRRGRRSSSSGAWEESSRTSSLSRRLEAGLGVSAGSLAEDWPDLMTSAGHQGRELRQACEAVTRWSQAHVDQADTGLDQAPGSSHQMG